MSHLGQYRLSIAVFSLGLLCVVSQVVGDGDNPGLLDTTTKSIVHRLDSANTGSHADAGAPVELAVSDAKSNPWGYASEQAAPDSAGASDPVEIDPSPPARMQDLPPPDPSMIHK